MRTGQMIVIGARPGVGKKSFCLILAVNAAAEGAYVAHFSVEMSKKEIAQRLLSAQAKNLSAGNPFGKHQGRDVATNCTGYVGVIGTRYHD